jgi:DNA-binding XRE family transcriptional regulator
MPLHKKSVPQLAPPEHRRRRVAAAPFLKAADDPTVKLTTGEKVFALRKTTGWSRYELGEAAGCSHATIKNIETSRSSPTLDTLGKVAAALKVNIRDLIGDEYLS